MSRPHASMELSVWALMAVPMGLLSGGVAGVLAHTLFDGRVPAWLLAAAVALLTGSGPLANIASVFWAHWSHGRPKVRALTRLQALFGGCLMLAAAVPLAPWGLAALVGAVLAAQVTWCGIITIRSNIWRRNYTRAARTAFAAQNQVIVSLVSASTGAATGWLLQQNADAFRWLFLVTGACAWLAGLRLRAVRLRRQRQLLTAERRRQAEPGFSPLAYWSILRTDPLYRRYMGWMMVLGSGNLMFTAPLILILTNNLAVSSFSQVLITAALPTLIAPLATPLWARMLAREHVIRFRRRNSLWYAAALASFAAGVMLTALPLLWLGAAVLGVGIGGGTLGWSLGHNDFAPDDRAAEYLGLHVSLTGIRGLVAPLVGVGLYGLLEAAQAGAGPFALGLPLLLTSAGAAGFRRLDRSIVTQAPS